MLYASDNPWADYLEALDKCCAATKLTAFHTSEAAKHTEKAADFALLVVYHVKEALHER